jgi:3-methyladenine DNA glycosylase AlkD
MATAEDVITALAVASSAEAASRAASFFKTGPGEYAEGDVFIGVTMPDNRKVAKRFVELPAGEVDALLWSEVHEHRMAGLLIMTMQPLTAELVAAYLSAAHSERVNNWDLVDASAEYILGAWLFDKPRGQLFALAKSDLLWERRIAIVATMAFLRRGDATTTLEIAEKLVREKHDLMQKAVGWLLRETGKRVDRALLVEFLDRNAGRMPRTMLSYATEHLDPETRARYRSVPRS